MSDFLKTLVERNKRFIEINEYKKLFASDAPKESFTFRINPISKLVVEKNAELLDISTGQFINILIDEFVSQIEKSKDIDNLILINNGNLISRLSNIFKHHNLSKAESFHLLSNYGIELNDLMNEHQLLKKLNSECLKKICGVFNVSMEWLFGFSTSIYSIAPMDGNLNAFVECILQEQNSGDDKNKIYFIFNKAASESFFLYEMNIRTNSVTHKKYMIFSILDWNDNKATYRIEKHIRICIELERKGLLTCHYVEFENEYFDKVSTGIEFIKPEYLNGSILWEDLNYKIKLSKGWGNIDNEPLTNEQNQQIESLISKGVAHD